MSCEQKSEWRTHAPSSGACAAAEHASTELMSGSKTADLVPQSTSSAALGPLHGSLSTNFLGESHVQGHESTTPFLPAPNLEEGATVVRR